MPIERQKFESVPIPTYEEATSSRPPSSSSFRGQQQQHSNDGAEQHRLLGAAPSDGAGQLRHDGRRRHYQPPTVESERSSYDSALTSPEISDDEDEGLRRDMEEMEVLEPHQAERRAQQRRGMRLPKPFESLRQTLSAISLPSLPSLPRNLPDFQALFSQSSSLPLRFKIPWPIIARLFGLFLIVSVVYTLLVFRVLGPAGQMMGDNQISYVRSVVLEAVDPKMIEEYLWEISFEDHIAGTKGDFFLASKIEQYFQNAELEVFRDNYEVYLNYPRKHGRRVAIIDPPDLRWVAKLEEKVAPEKAQQHQSAVFHGHSKSGNVTGPLIYANYGSREDFALLKENGIDLQGAIVIVRYYGTQGDRALKIKAAELAGAAGCLIYSDPGEDGEFKGDTYPNGRWRPKDSVQRGGVSLMSWVVGDVLTPGQPSKPETPRLRLDETPGLVKIPSLPLSWRDAKVLLASLDGKGMRVPADWEGGDKTGLEWFTGDATSPIVNLKNLLDDEERQPIRNIIGRIQGFEEPEKTIYVGNHRDAWCFGAVDPGSGTAVMLEVVRVFGLLKRRGWRPRRSIAFASWDAEEYNLIGSTEHVEERIGPIRRNGVAYLNVDSAVSGSDFWADASPMLRKPLMRVLKLISDPHDNQTLREKWDRENSTLGGLGAGSDYVAFQDLAGCSSLDFGFRGPQYGYPYHSCYDSFNWMKTHGDPDFAYHRRAAQVWGSLILELADERLLPMDLTFYAREIMRYVEDLRTATFGKLDVKALEDAAELFVRTSAEFDQVGTQIANHLAPAMLENRAQVKQRVGFNRRMSDFETNLLDLPPENENREGGVPGRNQFKHVIFGPQAWSGYDEAYFPAIRDAIDEENWKAAQAQLEIAAKVLSNAATKLVA